MSKADFSYLSSVYFPLQWKRSQRETEFLKAYVRLCTWVRQRSVERTKQTVEKSSNYWYYVCSPSIESNAEGSKKKTAASTWRCHFTNSNNFQNKPSTCVQWTTAKMLLQTHTIICTGHSTHYTPTTANTERNFTTMKPMLATFGSIQSRPTYRGGKLMGTIWYYENWIVHDHVC